MAEEVKNESVEQADGAPTENVGQPSGIPPKTVTTNGEQPQAPDLNVSDLNAVRSIIDIATTRGAFKANELEAVGKTYNKLTAFLDHVTKQKEQQGEK